MRNLIFLSGINASGKSTIAKALSEKTGIPFFEGSSILMNHFGFVPGDYDSLRAVSREEQLKGNDAALKKVSNDNEKAITIGHFMLTINGVSEPFLGDWFDNCSHLIHLWNEPEVIFNRTEKDERDRKLFIDPNMSQDEKIAFIKEVQEKSLHYAKQISERYNTPLFIIENKEVDMTVKEIQSLLES